MEATKPTAGRMPRSAPRRFGQGTSPTNATGWGERIDESIKATNCHKQGVRAKVEQFLASSDGSSVSGMCATEVGPKICIDLK